MAKSSSTSSSTSPPTASNSPQRALGQLIFMANPYAAPTDIKLPDDPANIQVEEDNYAAQWAFKGLTQNIKRALRIQYQYYKTDDEGNRIGYAVTENLIVGFAGSNGGG
jgi:hypothetical protein